MKTNRLVYSYIFACIILLITACAATMQLKTKAHIFDRQGHRGARGLMPENTVPAMLKALDEGVTTLEMDVVITADGQVILSHEPWMNSEITTKPDGSFITEKEAPDYNIYRMTYAEIKNYDVGSKPHSRFPQQQKIKIHKPLLSEVIIAVEKHKKTNKQPVEYNIETKCTPVTDGIFHPAPQLFVDAVMKVLQAHKITHQTTIQSFDVRSLQYINKAYPQLRTALLIEAEDKKTFETQLSNLGFIPTVYSPHYTLVTPQLVTACRSKKIKLIPWTVNELSQMQALKNLGVDGIITDYPNLFKELK